MPNTTSIEVNPLTKLIDQFSPVIMSLYFVGYGGSQGYGVPHSFVEEEVEQGHATTSVDGGEDGENDSTPSELFISTISKSTECMLKDILQ